MKEPHNIIQSICLTEKATRCTDQNNVYVFRCPLHATKPEIWKAVEFLFKKRVVRVNTLKIRGRERRSRTAAEGYTSDWKKAYVKLAEGETIDIA